MSKPGAICHIELPTQDLAASKTFYESVFGWSVQIIEDGTYGIFTVPMEDGEGFSASGGFEPEHEAVGETKGVILYLECEEVGARLDEIVAAGGERVREKAMISEEHGFLGLFRDPSGNLMGVWSRT